MKKLSDVAPHSEKNHSEKQPIKKSGSRKPSLLKENVLSHIKKRRLIIIIAVILILAIAITVVFGLITGHTNFAGNTVKNPNQTNKIAIKYYSPLTGKEVSTEAITERPVLAVMIENSPEARPQSGLKEAGVVFEAVAEGGITRFIALYQESEPSLIGPVRSVRPYYLDWAAGFSPAVAHVGGSNQALTMIRSGNYGVDLDQSSNSSAYWRTRDRRSPHNVYTDYSHLSSLAKAKGKTASKFTSLTRQPVSSSPKTDSEAATTINLNISTGKFAVSYKYNSESQTYDRYQGNVSHQDREKGQISPDVVVALHVNQTLQSDRIHNAITTVGSGECYIFQNGIVVKGSWQKDSETSQFKFLDASGAEIKLKRGQTWITAVPNGKAITWQ